jgi:hypothetical protein
LRHEFYKRYKNTRPVTAAFPMNKTSEKAIEAYGGKVLWEKARHIHAEVSAHGLAFTLKRRTFFKHAKIWIDIDS